MNQLLLTHTSSVNHRNPHNCIKLISINDRSKVSFWEETINFNLSDDFHTRQLEIPSIKQTARRQAEYALTRLDNRPKFKKFTFLKSYTADWRHQER